MCNKLGRLSLPETSLRISSKLQHLTISSFMWPLMIMFSCLWWGFSQVGLGHSTTRACNKHCSLPNKTFIVHVPWITATSVWYLHLLTRVRSQHKIRAKVFDSFKVKKWKMEKNISLLNRRQSYKAFLELIYDKMGVKFGRKSLRFWLRLRQLCLKGFLTLNPVVNLIQILKQIYSYCKLARFII